MNQETDMEEVFASLNVSKLIGKHGPDPRHAALSRLGGVPWLPGCRPKKLAIPKTYAYQKKSSPATSARGRAPNSCSAHSQKITRQQRESFRQVNLLRKRQSRLAQEEQQRRNRQRLLVRQTNRQKGTIRVRPTSAQSERRSSSVGNTFSHALRPTRPWSAAARGCSTTRTENRNQYLFREHDDDDYTTQHFPSNNGDDVNEYSISDDDDDDDGDEDWDRWPGVSRVEADDDSENEDELRGAAIVTKELIRLHRPRPASHSTSFRPQASFLQQQSHESMRTPRRPVSASRVRTGFVSQGGGYRSQAYSDEVQDQLPTNPSQCGSTRVCVPNVATTAAHSGLPPEATALNIDDLLTSRRIHARPAGLTAPHQRTDDGTIAGEGRSECGEQRVVGGGMVMSKPRSQRPQSSRGQRSTSSSSIHLAPRRPMSANAASASRQRSCVATADLLTNAHSHRKTGKTGNRTGATTHSRTSQRPSAAESLRAPVTVVHMATRATEATARPFRTRIRNPRVDLAGARHRR